MGQPELNRKTDKGYLSVIHRSQFTFKRDEKQTSDLIIHTDLDFNIRYANEATKDLFKKAGGYVSNLLDAGDLTFENGSIDEVKEELLKEGEWKGRVLYKRFDGEIFHYKVTCTSVWDLNKKPMSFVIVYNNLESEVQKEADLSYAENKYDGLLNSLSSGVMMIDRMGKILACNKSGIEILGLPTTEVVGNTLSCDAIKAIRMDGSEFPEEQFPAIVSLQTGFPQRNVIIGLLKPNDITTWVSINSEALMKPGEFEPYAVVASFTDITDFVNAELELIKSNERFNYVTNVTSDAIWDFDLNTNQIYRSEAFERISGYSKNEIGSTLNWWLDHIHPEDQARVKSKLENELLKGSDRWQDEYRFCFADGSYKVLNDSAIIISANGKPVRLIGAICDVTEEKNLKLQLAAEQKQRQREVTRAAIKAQEVEKSNISRELHDNVNQIIMSAKLYMETAKNNPAEAESLLETAIEYQMMAMQEIRKLSKNFNTEVIKQTKLRDSLADIVFNLSELQKINVLLKIDAAVDNQLCETARINLFRVIQEQTNNIIKYAEATQISIQLTAKDGNGVLTINDNGKGFDMSIQNNKAGIGMINMNSRALILDGTLKVHSAPGQGCELELSFPLGKPIVLS